MSAIHRYHIRCPKCGQEQDVPLYESIHVQESPALRESLLANRINAVACPGCGFTFRVEKPLLYRDLARRIFIYLLPLGGQSFAEGQREFLRFIQQLNGTLPPGVEAPPVHLVFSRSELVERIFLLEAGLNERVIEYIKYLVYSRNPGRIDPAQKVLLFDAEDSTETLLCFVIQDASTQRLEGLLQYSREAYQGFCEMFDRDDQTPSLLEMFPGPYVSARALMLSDSRV